MTSPDADAPLIERVKQGDVKAFEMLVVKYQRRIERLIGRMVRDEVKTIVGMMKQKYEVGSRQ